MSKTILFQKIQFGISTQFKCKKKVLFQTIQFSISHHHHHHHIVSLARISLTLSHHFSLSFIASGRSSGLHPVSSHSCCIDVLASRPVFARPYAGVHRSTSLMSSSLLLHLCSACLVRLTWIMPKTVLLQTIQFSISM